MATWSHPELGEFNFDGHAWRTELQLPAFNVFRQRCRRIPERRGETDVYIWSIDETDIPTGDIADLVSRIIRNHERLIPRIVEALIAEFRGIGPKTGMWWHGAVQSIEESITRENRLRPNHNRITADNIERLLSPPDLFVRDKIAGQFRYWRDGASAVAEFVFSSPIDPEHGIGLLTDGDRIVGIGHSGEADHFEE